MKNFAVRADDQRIGPQAPDKACLLCYRVGKQVLHSHRFLRGVWKRRIQMLELAVVCGAPTSESNRQETG